MYDSDASTTLPLVDAISAQEECPSVAHQSSGTRHSHQAETGSEPGTHRGIRFRTLGSSRAEAAGARSSPPILLSDQSILSCHSSRDASYEHGADFVPCGTRVRAGSIQRSGKASPDIGTEALSSSLGKTSVTFAPMSYVPVLGAIRPGATAETVQAAQMVMEIPLRPARHESLDEDHST